MKNKIVLVALMVLMFLALIAGIFLSLDCMNLTLAVCLTLALVFMVVGFGKYVSFAYDKKHGMGNFEEANLAQAYQNNNINRMHRNIILFLVPVLIFGGYSFNDYVLHKDYTHRMNANFETCIGFLHSDNLGTFDELLADPIINITLHEGYNREVITTASLILSTAVNARQTILISNSIKSKLETSGIISEDEKQKLMSQLEEADSEIDNVFGKLQIDANSKYQMDTMLSNLQQLNYKFKEINLKIYDSLEKNTLTYDKYKELISSFDITGSFENTYQSTNKMLSDIRYKIFLDIILFRIAWLTTILSIVRIIGICIYYIRKKRYQAKLL